MYKLKTPAKNNKAVRLIFTCLTLLAYLDWNNIDRRNPTKSRSANPYFATFGPPRHRFFWITCFRPPSL